MAENATHNSTGRIRNQAFWFTSLVVPLMPALHGTVHSTRRMQLAQRDWRDAQQGPPRSKGRRPPSRGKPRSGSGGSVSWQQLLVLVEAGVLAQHLQPHGVARRRQALLGGKAGAQ